MYRVLLGSLLLVFLFSGFAQASPVGPWVLLGAEDGLLNGICSSGRFLFATTEEGYLFYDRQSEQWTDRTWPGWVGKSKYAVVEGQIHDHRLVAGGVNAWFKGTLFYSDDMGEDDHLVHESTGGRVTDLESSLFGEPAMYACTWSDIVDGEFLHSSDDGESWSAIYGHGHHAMTDLAVLGDQEVFLAGDNYVAHTMDGGATWDNLQANLPDGQGIYCIFAQPHMSGLPSPQKDETNAAVLIASNDTGLYKYDFDTSTWQLILPVSCRSIAERSGQIGEFSYLTETYAVTWDGRVMFCRNWNWDNWEEVTNELSPGTPIDVEATYWGIFVAMQGGGVYQSTGASSPVDMPNNDPLLSMEAFPNPFNPSTTISFNAPKAGHALLQVFDLRGALVATLVDGDVVEGVHSCQWQPSNLGSGVYQTMLSIGGGIVSGSVVLLK